MRGFEWYKLHQNLITRSRVICDFVCYTNHVIGIAELRITMRNSIQKSAILRIWRNNCSVILSHGIRENITTIPTFNYSYNKNLSPNAQKIMHKKYLIIIEILVI